MDANKQGLLFHFNFPFGRLLIVIINVVILRDFLSRGPTDDLSEVHRWKKREACFDQFTENQKEMFRQLASLAFRMEFIFLGYCSQNVGL